MEQILHLSRPIKRAACVLLDTFAIIYAFWLAMFLRVDSGVDIYNSKYWALLAFVIVLSITTNVILGLYRAVIRFLNSRAIAAVGLSVIVSSSFVALGSLIFDVFVPRSIPVIYGAFLLIIIGGSRFLVRSWANRLNHTQKARVLIYGAGSAGIQLVNALRNGREYDPVVFIDDDRALHGLTIHGLSVRSSNNLDKIIVKQRISRILLALPSASKSERSRILNKLEKTKIEVLAIPGMADLVSGKSKIDDFVEVSIEDLLGRDPVPPNQELLHADIEDKVVMVTGAGGSIGSELCRQILQQKPQSLILFEAGEYNLYSIHSELEKLVSEQGLNIQVVPILGKVQNKHVISRVMQSFKVQTIYHAAAYKHVPIVEGNVVEGVFNNVFGTLRAAEAAIDNNVETFVLISTDKAVRPTNVMGTTKRMAELCLQALADKTDHNTRFCMVRFGNVLGSSGSVVPLFKKQIAQGGPITLTHKDITRYFMTIPEAAQLVIQAGAMGVGGDVFVLDMGKPVKIFDLASKLIHLSGLHLRHEGNLNGDIDIIETGLRPGEKLYEELLIGDNVIKTGNKRIMSASEVFLSWQELEPLLNTLHTACIGFDQATIREVLLIAPCDFKPVDEICDWVYLSENA
ncbi:polysaccharide biosynthesis protein [Colwelliaceae bacterium BS250]